MWHSVTSSHVQWQQVAPVTSSGNRCLLVVVRSHFGLRLGGRNNPDRASNRILGRRITRLLLHSTQYGYWVAQYGYYTVPSTGVPSEVPGTQETGQEGVRI